MMKDDVVGLIKEGPLNALADLSSAIPNPAAMEAPAIARGIGKAFSSAREALGRFGKVEKTTEPIVNAASPAVKRSGSQIDRAAFRSQRETFWKNEAKSNRTNYSEDNLKRMDQGKAPTGQDGKPMELHHTDGTPSGSLEPMSRQQHREGDNFLKNHPWLDD
jgi:hypothetical protein